MATVCMISSHVPEKPLAVSPSFLKNLKLVAVDELHYYSNIYGRYVVRLDRQHPADHFYSHVAQVMRRFRRVCAAVGSTFRFSLLSIMLRCLWYLFQIDGHVLFRVAQQFRSQNNT